MPTLFYADENIQVDLVTDEEYFHSLADIPQWCVQVLSQGDLVARTFRVSLVDGNAVTPACAYNVAEKVFEGVNFELSKSEEVIADLNARYRPKQKLLETINDLIGLVQMTGSLDDINSPRQAVVRIRNDLYVYFFRRRPTLNANAGNAVGTATIMGEPGVMVFDGDFPTADRIGNNPVIPAEIIQRFNVCWPNKAIVLEDVRFSVNDLDTLFSQLEKAAASE